MGKLIFFDIDGTIWDENRNISKSTKQTLQRLRAAGHRIFLCSGRARGNIRSKELLSLGFDGIVAACGAHVEMDGQVLLERLVSPELTRRVIDVTHACRMPVVLEGPKELWIDEVGFETDAYVDALYRELGPDARPLRGYTPEIFMNKFSADVWPYTDYRTVKEKLGRDFDFLEHEGSVVVECVPKGISKASGIKEVCRLLGADPADTVAVGDSVNDLSMIRAAGYGIAMGNAASKVQEAADYVTAGLREDGIRQAMEHFGLI